MTAEHEEKETVPKETPKAARAKPADGIISDFTDKFCEKIQIASLKFIPDVITKKCAERKREAKK